MNRQKKARRCRAQSRPETPTVIVEKVDTAADRSSCASEGITFYENGNFQEALQICTIALSGAKVPSIDIRRRRDKCKLLLGHFVTPDFLEEPLDKDSMTQAQMIAYWRSQPISTDPGTAAGACFNELAWTTKLRAEEEILVNAFRSLYGWGDPRNLELALEFFKTAASRSEGLIEAEAKYFIALLWIHGPKHMQSPIDGLALLESVALMSPKNPLDAPNKFRRVGVAEAQCALGAFYLKYPVENSLFRSPQIAAFWFTKAHLNGNVHATAWLGFLSYAGQGVPKNEAAAEDLWKAAANSSKCKEAYVYLIHLYMSQLEILQADSMVRRALEVADDYLSEVINKLKGSVRSKHGERKNVQTVVDRFNKLHPNLNRLCFRDQFQRSRNGSELNPSVSEVYKNCKGKFSIQLSTFNEFVKRNSPRPNDSAAEIVSHKYLEDIKWKAATGIPEAKSVLDMLTHLTRLLNLVGKCQNNLSIFRSDPMLADTLVTTLYRVLEHEPFYLKWQVGHLKLLYQALKIILSAKHEINDLYKKNLKLELGMIGSMLEPFGEGHKYLLEAWGFYNEESMPVAEYARVYYMSRDYNRAYIVLEEGLERFEKHLYFLFMIGMVCVRNESGLMIGSYDMKQRATMYLQKFLIAANKEHPKVPEAYYVLGKCYYELYKLEQKPDHFCCEIVEHFLKLGKEAEDSQMLCFLPYDSSFRALLETVLQNSPSYNSRGHVSSEGEEILGN